MVFLLGEIDAFIAFAFWMLWFESDDQLNLLFMMYLVMCFDHGCSYFQK